MKLFSLRFIRRFKSFKPESSLLIFSDPRGGSTWFAEIVNKIPGTFIYWEPLAEVDRKPLRGFNFGWRQHIPQNESWPEVKSVFDSILTASKITEFTSYMLTPKHLMIAKLPVIKLCRGNDLLFWLLNQYQFRYKPLYIIRHPFAVVASQLKQGGWDGEFSVFSVPDMPFNYKYVEHVNFLQSLTTKEEQLCAVWCITNRDLGYTDNKQFLRVTYEQMLLNPEFVIDYIFENWNIPLPKGVYEQSKKKSSTTVDYGNQDSNQSQLKKWETVFTDDQINKLQKVLDYFEVDLYSSKEYISTSLWLN